MPAAFRAGMMKLTLGDVRTWRTNILALEDGRQVLLLGGCVDYDPGVLTQDRRVSRYE
jgi:hypothetical protein